MNPVELPLSLTPRQIMNFWKKVDKSGECWTWKGGRDSGGYGLFSVFRRMYKAHRIACLLAGMPITKDLVACHKCDNPPCVRSEHLFLGTYEDNQKDAASKGRWKGERNGAYTHPESRLKGERNGRCLLTVQQVHDIRHRYESTDTTHQALANEYGLTKGGIANIVNRRTWAHV